MNGYAKYYIGNSGDLDKIFQHKKIPSPTLIISSPPYYDLLDYDGVKGQIGFGQSDYDVYLIDVAHVFQHCYELAEDNATFWLIIDTLKKRGEITPLPFDIHRILKKKYEKTWKLKDIIIWDKGKNLPWNSKGKFKNQFEYILFFIKGSKFKFNIDKVREINDLKKWWLSYPERYNPQGKAPSNVWQYTTPIRGWGNGKQNHFCPIPFPLAEKIISIASDKGDVIFDPFAGSGSALALASIMGRRSYGTDINKVYKKRFETEVINGAKTYWNKRKAELQSNSEAIIDFTSTNNKLRKLKVAATIAKYFKETHVIPFIHVLINKPGPKFDLFIIENGIKPTTDITDEGLTALIKQAKVEPNINVISENEIADTIIESRLYRYSLKKFYSNNRMIKRDSILKSKGKYNFVYSNINLKIK